jgi:hypothetical protein
VIGESYTAVALRAGLFVRKKSWSRTEQSINSTVEQKEGAQMRSLFLFDLNILCKRSFSFFYEFL